MIPPNDARQYAPATERNREPILEVLLQVLPRAGTILEVAGGTGEHAIFFAPRLLEHRWIPTDKDPMLLESINAWRERFPSDNLEAALELDARDRVWSIEEKNLDITAIVNINMIHIAPQSACLGLMAGAGRILPRGGILYLYGPFQIDGKHTAASNLAFDRSLRERNPEWGVRDLNEVVEAAKARGLDLLKIVPMPANNFSVVFKKG